ncbi:MAG: methyltransferase domain-containing protein [Verrucomicrobiia bacterium]
MSQTPPSVTTTQTANALQRYYRFHSAIYDVSRWSFLFGRSRMGRLLTRYTAPARVLDVGCGTGENISQLCRLFPRAEFVGVDLSAVMLRIARRKLESERRRIQWLCQTYDQPVSPTRPFDLIVFSYSLSMMNPGWDAALRAAALDLAPDGWLAAVDFDRSRWWWFERWMSLNHVRMGGHLLPALRSVCDPWCEERRSAYAGLWQYFIFIGSKHPKPAAGSCV